MASEPIRSTAVVNAPKDYDIPTAQQIRLLSVLASFTDNGAAGDWLPALQILDNNGNVLVTAADQGVKVTAGSDADVSWFPGVTPQQATGTGLTNLSVAMGRVDPANPPVILAGSSTTITWSIVTIEGPGIVWTAGLPRQVTVNDGGAIIASVTVAPSLDWPNTAAGVIKISQTYNTSEPLGVQTIYAGHPQIDAFDPSGGSPGQLTSFAFMSNVTQGANPAHWTATIQNTTAANFTLGQDTSFAIARVSPWVNF